MLHIVTAVEECDATGDAMIYKAGFKKIIIVL